MRHEVLLDKRLEAIGDGLAKAEQADLRENGMPTRLGP